MSKATIKAQEIIDSISNGENIDSIKLKYNDNPNDWYSFSSKAYNITLEKARKQRKLDEANPHILTTPNSVIDSILKVNEKLSDYALMLPMSSTKPELDVILELEQRLPNSESEIIEIIVRIIMSPRHRTLQKKGRFQKLNYFKIFTKMIDAATLCYYRANYISCYLTLIPVIEGIIIRWMGFTQSDEKPEFEEIKKFFKNSAMRQPCPSNILFHNIYTKVCDKILIQHLYRHTSIGDSHANFNRHVASHLLKDDEFATRQNCVRLFTLLDTMSEIYLYESCEKDPRFELTGEEIIPGEDLLLELLRGVLRETPELKYPRT